VTNELTDRISDTVDRAIRDGVRINDFVLECEQHWIEALQEELKSAQKSWRKLREAMLR
jgi:hypothetical protein